MKIIKTLEALKAFKASLNKPLHFVPTMGNLHLGHATLIERAKATGQPCMVSIFVNPTQFNQTSDYDNYPSTLEADFALLEKLGVDACFLPTESLMYPNGYAFQVSSNSHWMDKMEALFRPGHFEGVLTVVLKLLLLTAPKVAYFGDKDYQQLKLIKAMVDDLFLDIDIVPCYTYRLPSGLPFSSRNNRLSAKEKELADAFAHCFHQKEKSCETLKSAINALGLRVEYLEEYDNRRFIAAWLGDVRLIDNYAL